MRFDVITLFGDMFDGVTDCGVTRRAFEQKKFELKRWNPRDFTQDNYKTIDDRPYGGGPGMVMLYKPLKDAYQAIQQEVASSHLIYLSPQGKPLTQNRVLELAQKPQITLLCGRYEGVDERFIETFVDEEISMGDFIVSGGELPAMMLMDAVIRTLPGVLNHELSAEQDSFSDGLLDCPHYSRPEKIDNMSVPQVLLEGNHSKIAQWREMQQLYRTYKRRPDMFKNKALTSEQEQAFATWLKLMEDKG